MERSSAPPAPAVANGAAFVVRSRERMAAVADRLAVEHVAFHVAEPEALLAQVRAQGAPLPADILEASDLILPHEDSSMDEVRKLLTDEGLIPG